MALVAPDGSFMRVNEALCDIVGYAPAELAALTFQDITHPDDCDTDVALAGEVLSGARRTYQLEKRYVRSDGSLVWVLLSVSLVRDAAGAPLHFISQIQDISERKLQFSDKPPQFSLGKSLDGFGPIGPAVVSLDAFRDPNDLEITCEVSGERLQHARTTDMIFSVPELVAFLSRFCTLEAGDLIFTGTPAGIGSVRTPRRYLKEGEVIHTTIEGIGELVNACVAR